MRNFSQISLEQESLKGMGDIFTMSNINRKYLLNVINTVAPNSVIKAVFDIRRTRER